MRDSLRICFICQTLDTLGGVQRAVSLLSNALISRGHEVCLLMDKPKMKSNPYGVDFSAIKVADLSIQRSSGLIIRAVSKMRRRCGVPQAVMRAGFPPASMIDKSAMVALRDYMAEQEFDVVVGCDPLHTIIARAACGSPETLVCGWQHSTYDGYFAHCDRGFYGAADLFAKTIRQCDLNFVLTEESREAYRRATGVDSYVLPNAINTVNTHVDISAKHNQILYCGRLDAGAKGADNLPAIIEELERCGFDGRFVIAGDGPYRQNLTRWMQSHKGDCEVQLLGFVDDPTSCYINARVLVSPSRWEGFGLSILEAMACGTPCIAFSNDGPRSLISNGNNGFLVPNGDCVALAKKAYGLSQNERERTEMSKKAIQTARLYAVDRQVERFLSALAGVVQR